MTRSRLLSIEATVALCLCISGAARADVDRPIALAHDAQQRRHDGFFLRLSLGSAYLHESWRPDGAAAGAVYSGFGPSFDAAIGRTVRPGLVIGGRWQFAAVVDPNESYEGTTYVVSENARFIDVLGAFVDYYPARGRGFHFGGSLGAVAVSDRDGYVGSFVTTWGPGASAHVGVDMLVSRMWSAGAVAELLIYRYGTSVPAPSATSDGILPSLAVAFTFN